MGAALAAPSPLVGEGGEGGLEAARRSWTLARHLPTPIPSPSPQGGGEEAL
jgi:hypothetical protein